jgi:hypothetical protein
MKAVGKTISLTVLVFSYMLIKSMILENIRVGYYTDSAEVNSTMVIFTGATSIKAGCKA